MSSMGFLVLCAWSMDLARCGGGLGRRRLRRNVHLLGESLGRIRLCLSFLLLLLPERLYGGIESAEHDSHIALRIGGLDVDGINNAVYRNDTGQGLPQ